MKAKPETKIYLNAVHAFGGAQLTVGDLLALIERDKIPHDAILVASADEEGNRYGHVFQLHSEKLTKNVAAEIRAPELAGKRAVIITPAI